MPKSLRYPLLVERQRCPRLPLLLLQRHHIVVEAGNLDAAAAILHLREHLRQDEGRVGHRAAERARVQVGAAAAQIDLEVDQAAQPVADRRHAAREHRRVGDDDDVGAQLAACARTKSSRLTLPTSSSPSRMNFMLTGSVPFCFRCASTALKCMNTWPLSSADAARVDLAVAHRRLERRRLPEIERIDRLHVVVPVEEDGRRARRAEPVAVDDRVARRVDQPHVLQADAPHLLRAPVGAAPDVGGVLRQRADARDREKRLQLVEVAIAIDVDEIDDVVHGMLR